jgi:hypothetical protein
MHFQMQEESQQSPQIEFESDSESQRNIAAQDETTQDVTEQDAILSPVPRRNKKKKTTGDLRLEKAFRILEQAGDSDESQAFGIFVGKKLKTYTAFTRSGVQHAISNILFNADRGYYEPQQQYSKQDQSPSLVSERQHSTFLIHMPPSLATTASDDYKPRS